MGTSLFIHKVYNRFIVLGAHILMVILWLVDLGVVANLARIWASPNCYYSYAYGGYNCFYGKKRGLESNAFEKRDDRTTIKTYRNVLIVGALLVLSSCKLTESVGCVYDSPCISALWVFSAVIVIQHLNKHNTDSSHSAPVFTGGNNDQAVPMEQTVGQTAPMQPQSVYPPAQQYPVGMPPQSQYSSPMAQPQGEYQHQQTQYLSSPYGHDPVSRTHTVSPVSQSNTYVPSQNASELGTQQHIGGYDPNVSELSVQK